MLMKGHVTNIETETLENKDFRRVIYTAEHSQLVVMSIPPNDEIGVEVHDVDQFIRIEKGEGQSVLDGVERDLTDGSVVVIPAGVRHNIKNTSAVEPMQLYTLYSPPHHEDGVVHHTKMDAEKDDEHFDGETTDDLNP
jgi:mannose-6-phosphate isomerase-like protein (cupin superfamily)